MSAVQFVIFFIGGLASGVMVGLNHSGVTDINGLVVAIPFIIGLFALFPSVIGEIIEAIGDILS